MKKYLLVLCLLCCSCQQQQDIQTEEWMVRLAKQALENSLHVYMTVCEAAKAPSCMLTTGLHASLCTKAAKNIMNTPQLNEYQRELRDLAYNMAIPLEEAFSEETLNALSYRERLAMLMYLEAHITEIAANTLVNKHNLLNIYCQEKLELGDTLVVLMLPQYPLQDSMIHAEGEVFVKEGKASLSYSQAEAYSDKSIVLYKCIPQQRGQHYVRLLFTMQSPQGFKQVLEIGRNFWVR